MVFAQKILTPIYRWLFLRRACYKINLLIYRLALRGLGILNYENEKINGEDHFLRSLTNIETQLCVIDVGAHEGQISKKIKELNPSAIIYAFEPHPNTFKELESVALKFDFYAINKACSDEIGCIKLYDFSNKEHGTQHASLYLDVIEKIHDGNSTAWDIEVTTLDTFINKLGLAKIHLLKIDTEGHDYRVLLGAKQSIHEGKVDIIQFEFNEMNVVSRVFFRDFYQYLYNYVFFRMVPDGLVPLGKYTPNEWEIFGYQNIIAIRKDSQYLQEFTDA